MNIPVSVQKILDSIQKLSEEEKFLLFVQLTPQLKSIQTKQKTDIAKSENPWVKYAGNFENDPQYDEVLAYIEQYRHELDAEIELYERQLEEEVKQF